RPRLHRPKRPRKSNLLRNRAADVPRRPSPPTQRRPMRRSRPFRRRRTTTPPRTPPASQGARAGGNGPSGSCRGAAFHPRFTARNAKRAAMNSPLARLARLIMLVVMLSMAAVRPAFAQQGDGAPSVLRDTETERLFKDMSRPILVAAAPAPKGLHVVITARPARTALLQTGQTPHVD